MGRTVVSQIIMVQRLNPEVSVSPRDLKMYI
jgi:hypothetical protein